MKAPAPSRRDGGAISAVEAIEQLLSAQIVPRNNRRLQTAMRSSRLPAVKTLGQFDFAFQRGIKREQVGSLHELGFLDRGENVIPPGPPGVGKTPLAIGLGYPPPAPETIVAPSWPSGSAALRRSPGWAEKPSKHQHSNWTSRRGELNYPICTTVHIPTTADKQPQKLPGTFSFSQIIVEIYRYDSATF